MTNHPNRSAGTPGATPTPAAIREAREAVGLSQTAAAATIYSSLGAWQKWEQGDRRMHPGLFELFLIKAKNFICEN